MKFPSKVKKVTIQEDLGESLSQSVSSMSEVDGGNAFNLKNPSVPDELLSRNFLSPNPN